MNDKYFSYMGCRQLKLDANLSLMLFPIRTNIESDVFTDTSIFTETITEK